MNKIYLKNNNLIKHLNELRNFLFLWGSQSLSTLGSSMTSYALLIWVYQQKKSTMGVALLAVFTYLPSVTLSFLAGAFVDRHDKKKIMLFCDSIAVICTTTLFILMMLGKLEVWHIYINNMVISVMNAFQSPADTVAISQIVPKKYYMKIGGLQSISSSSVGILTPALATTCITFFGYRSVFLFDIITFLIAFFSLLFVIKIPRNIEKFKNVENKNSYLRDCKEGFLFLKNNIPLLQLILFFTAINLVAYIGGGGITTTVAAMILSRVPKGEAVLGTFTTAVALGTLVGGIVVTLMRSPKSKIATIFISCGVSFFICDLSLGLSQNPATWIIANFLGNVPIALLSANQAVIMRTNIPIELQGRVFSVRDTLQYCTIPLGYLLGGVLADHVFEPLMVRESFIQRLFCSVVGDGKGSGIAVMFIFTGIIGTVISLFGYWNKNMRSLDK